MRPLDQQITTSAVQHHCTHLAAPLVIHQPSCSTCSTFRPCWLTDTSPLPW
jgi:hypothetical protein